MEAEIAGVIIGVMVVVFASVVVVTFCRRTTRSKNELIIDKLNTTGCRWLLRLLFDIPRMIFVIYLVTSLFQSGLDDHTFDHPLVYISIGAIDVVVFVLYLLCKCACCKMSGPVFKEQANVYLFYSLTLGFPFGTATKIMGMLHLGGVNIPRDSIPVPYLVEIAIVTLVVLVLQCYVLLQPHKERSKCWKCLVMGGFYLLLAYLVFFWLFTFSLLYHAGFYQNLTSYHMKYWMVCLLPEWSIAAGAFVYEISNVWLLFLEDEAELKKSRCYRLLFMTPNILLLVGYVAVALVLTAQADGLLTDGSSVQTLVIVTECVCLVLVVVAGAFAMCWRPTRSNKIHVQPRRDTSVMPKSRQIEIPLKEPAMTRTRTHPRVHPGTHPATHPATHIRSHPRTHPRSHIRAHTRTLPSLNNPTHSSTSDSQNYSKPTEQRLSPTDDGQTSSRYYYNISGGRLHDGTRVLPDAWQ